MAGGRLAGLEEARWFGSSLLVSLPGPQLGKLVCTTVILPPVAACDTKYQKIITPIFIRNMSRLVRVCQRGSYICILPIDTNPKIQYS